MGVLVKWQGFEVKLGVPISKSMLHAAAGSGRCCNLATQRKAVSVATRTGDLLEL